MCESCLMPFSKDTGARESDKYCSLCFKNGTLCYTGNDRREFQKICYAQMRKNGLPAWKARVFAFMIRFAPRWKK